MDKSKQITTDAIGNNTSKQTFSSSKSSYTNAGSLRHSDIRPVQNFLLVWLDASADEVKNKDCSDTISKLREVVNTVHIFTNVDECINFIGDIKEEKIFIIFSEAVGQIAVPIVHDLVQVNTIYIICETKSQHEQWIQQWFKVKDVFTDITSICEALKKAVYEYEQNIISMSFIDTTDDNTNKNLDKIDQSFIYTQILKEIVLTIDFEQQHINNFISYCREQFVGNDKELKTINMLEQEYHQHVPIWWYTHECFLSSMLNRALRLMEIDLVINISFFIQDLHKHIKQLHMEQYTGHTDSNSCTVYRGQGLYQKDFDQLVKTKNGLLSFNNFMSAGMDRQKSLNFARETMETSGLVGILFVITIDLSISATPFGSVRDVGYFQEKEEVLFSIQSIFRIGNIKQIDTNDNRLWQVELVLTSDNDPQLHGLIEHIREETCTIFKGWHPLGKLMVNMGQFNKAEELYEILIHQASSEDEKAHLYHMLGIVKSEQGAYVQAITYYEKSIEINQKILTPIHPNLAASYGNLGQVYNKMGEYSKALSFNEKALEIHEKTLPSDHFDLATSYACHGSIYNKMGEYPKALLYYEKALEIYQKILPSNHPDLAISYGNIGQVLENMNKYSTALSYYAKALEIRQKILPPNHPHMATSYDCHGSVYNRMGEYSWALVYYEKALQINRETLPSNHPHLAISYNNIGLVYDNMGERTKALSYYEKALQIDQNTLPQNHPDMAISYSNIGLVYDNMGEFSKALSYYEKDLEIKQKVLSQNHPHLAISYSNIGQLYNKMGQHSKALSYCNKALEIRQNILPENHPDLAMSYNDIGNVYDKMGDYSKALSFYERAVQTGQRSLSADNADLQVYKKNVESIKKEL